MMTDNDVFAASIERNIAAWSAVVWCQQCGINFAVNHGVLCANCAPDTSWDCAALMGES